jgi:AcrR family transcriptional regulator
MEATRGRIVDVARELLGRQPEASMGDIAAAAGVVRRTVYGYFPARDDLVRTLAAAAVDEMTAVLEEVERPGLPADEVWARFVVELWPLAHRYRVLLALRRGAHGEEIHVVLRSVDVKLANLVRRGQGDGVFGVHLPPAALARLSSAAVFAIADDQRSDTALDARAAVVTSLLTLGVASGRAQELGRELVS